MPSPANRADRTRAVRGAAMLLAVLSMLPATLRAEEESEFALFRMTEVSGYFALRGLRDEVTTSSSAPAGGPVTTQSTLQSDLRATALVFLSTRSFFYHPSFVTLDFGVGPIFQNATFRSDINGTQVQENSAEEVLYDLIARATFLKDKPYTGSIYYEHLNPYVSVGPAQVILQENDRTGAEFSLLDPATPVPITLEAQRYRSKGTGSDQKIDDVTDRYSLSASRSFARAGDTRFRATTEQLDSESGSTGAPIVPSRRRSDSLGLDTRLQFGTNDKYRLTNVLSYNTLAFQQGQVVPADRSDARAFLDVRAQNTPTFSTYATVDGTRSKQNPQDTRLASAQLGTSWTPVTDLILTLEARGDDLRNNEVTAESRGGYGAVTYEFPLFTGKFVTSYQARYDDRSQDAQSLTTEVIGERLVMTGLAFVPLARPRVVESTIVVSNEARTQVYVRGRDYLVSTIGEETRLQRIVTGDIADGQAVLVDYSFEIGGTFSYTQLDQNAGIQWNWGNYFSIYARWYDSKPTLKEGVPLRTLNTVTSKLVGTRFDVPLGRLFFLGGSYETARRDETILPATSQGADVYLQIDEALIGQGGIRLSGRRQRVDYETAGAQDVDLTGYDIRYFTYTPWGLEVQADWSHESDVGGILERVRDMGLLRLRWRFRQLLATLDFTRTRESQGPVETTRTAGTFLLQRNF